MMFHLSNKSTCLFFCEDFIDEKTIGVDSGIDEGEWGGGGVFPTGLAKNT